MGMFFSSEINWQRRATQEELRERTRHFPGDAMLVSGPMTRALGAKRAVFRGDAMGDPRLFSEKIRIPLVFFDKGVYSIRLI